MAKEIGGIFSEMLQMQWFLGNLQKRPRPKWVCRAGSIPESFESVFIFSSLSLSLVMSHYSSSSDEGVGRSRRPNPNPKSQGDSLLLPWRRRARTYFHTAPKRYQSLNPNPKRHESPIPSRPELLHRSLPRPNLNLSRQCLQRPSQSPIQNPRNRTPPPQPHRPLRRISPRRRPPDLPRIQSRIGRVEVDRA